MNNSHGIPIHSKSDFLCMHKAGKLASEILDEMVTFIRPGMTTEDINKKCHEMIIDAGAIPAPLNYKGFPKSVCTSINDVVCHGIPGDLQLNAGDIINVDVTVRFDGWYGDTSRTFYIGSRKKIPIRAQKLCEVTYDAMMKAIEMIKPGIKTGDISHFIQNYVENRGFSIVRNYSSHGLGREFHCPPNITHHGEPDTGDVLEEGMFFTIEPMVNAGKANTRVLKDGWTVLTTDRECSAQFEHSVGVTKDGCEIFTISPKGYHRPPYT